MDTFFLKNSQYWRKADAHFTPKEKNGTLLVDLMIGSCSNVMSACILAKYLRYLKGYDITGLLPDISFSQKFQEIAISYGITQFVHYEQTISQYWIEEVKSWIKNAIRQGTLKLNDVESLKESLLKLEFDGVLVGDLLYEQYIRETQLPTIFDVTHFVRTTLEPSVRAIANALTILDGSTYSAAIMSHLCYVKFGIVSRFIVHRGGQVYMRKPIQGPYRICLYKNVNEFLQRGEGYIETPEIDFAERHFGNQACDIAEENLKQRMSGRISAEKSETYAYLSDKRIYTRTELAEATGTDEKKPNIFVMSQVFWDAVSTTRKTAFHDHYHWIKTTVEAARNIPEANWIFKEHPANDMAPDSWSCHRIIKDYVDQYAHIAYCPSDLTQKNMTDIVDAGICIHDSGIEFATHGIPVLNPGGGMTSAIGIGMAPKTVADYEECLRQLPYSEKLSASDIRKAKLHWYLYMCSRTNLEFVPNDRDLPQSLDYADAYLAKSVEPLENIDVRNEEMFRNLKYMLETGQPWLHNFVAMGLA